MAAAASRVLLLGAILGLFFALAASLSYEEAQSKDMLNVPRHSIEASLPDKTLVQNCTTPEAIVATCKAFLLAHEMVGGRWGKSYHYYRPGLEKYGPHQWLWDSAAHQITWARLNVTNAILSLRTLMSMQRPNGMIPQVVFWGPSSLADRALLTLMWGQDQYQQMSQMPVTPFALRSIYEVARNVSLLHEFVPPLVRYLEWWNTDRNLFGDDLLSIIHGWESGMDASPVYDLAYGVTVPHPSTFDLYPKFDELVLEYSLRYGWNMTTILARTQAPDTWMQSWFYVQDVGVNAVYAAAWGVLGDLAAEYDATLAAKCKAQQALWTKRIITQCWDQRLQRFVSFYRTKNNTRVPVTVEGAQSILPLLLDLPADMVASIVKTQVTNPKKFWTTYPVPTVAADAAQFEAVFRGNLMWRGPMWPIINWFTMEALGRHNQTQVQKAMLSKWIAVYQKSGVWEQYNPLTGEPYGVEGLGMSTLLVDWLYRFGIVH